MKLRIIITNPDDRTIIECSSKEDFLSKLSEMIDHAESDNGTHFDVYVYSNGYMFGIYTNKIDDTPSLSTILTDYTSMTEISNDEKLEFKPMTTDKGFPVGELVINPSDKYVTTNGKSWIMNRK